jgi:hypothetical protein
MLARKYYAQRGNSKGKMNTRAVAGSTNTRINKLLRSQTNNTSKTLDNYTSEKHTETLKHLTMKCSTEDNTKTRECNASCLNSTKPGRKYTDIHKDIVFNTQGEHLQKIKEQRACLENEPKPYNNVGCSFAV